MTRADTAKYDGFKSTSTSVKTIIPTLYGIIFELHQDYSLAASIKYLLVCIVLKEQVAVGLYCSSK